MLMDKWRKIFNSLNIKKLSVLLMAFFLELALLYEAFFL